MNKRLVAICILGQVLSMVGAGVAMFWSAGRMDCPWRDWWSAWAGLAVWLAGQKKPAGGGANELME